MKEQDKGVKWFNTIFYPQKRIGRSVRYEDGVLPRLRSDEVVLFTPWGPRYSWESRGILIQESDKEVEVLKFLKDLFGQMQQNMPDKKFRWLFLGADLYGTRVNNLSEEVVTGYFDSVAQWVSKFLPMAEFQLWSGLNEVAEEYRQQVRADFHKFIGHGVLARATQTAKAMGRNSSAKDYLVERVAEAMLIEQTYKPIKISCVARYKDDGVDWELPRLYFLPDCLHAAWL